MAFGQTVRFHCNYRGFGLNAFAERLGVSPAYWSRVEREQENPPRDEARALQKQYFHNYTPLRNH
jgi:transcriptional regulator with XRE-family HTH domain